jgi:hypothetical protein
MLGCGAGLLVLVLVAIGGAVICGAFCFSMVRMMVVRPRRS